MEQNISSEIAIVRMQQDERIGKELSYDFSNQGILNQQNLNLNTLVMDDYF